MKMKLNRRIFLALLGTASAAAISPRKRPVRTAASIPSNSLYYFSARGNQPAGRPRSAAITYVPIDLEAHVG